MSVCRAPSGKCLLTGGSDVDTAEPSSNTFYFHVNEPSNFTRKEDMGFPRYGHCSVHVNGQIYVIGGFAHSDTEEGC